MNRTTQTPALAIDGGSKVRQRPWPGRRLIGVEEKQAAMELFDKAIADGQAFGYQKEEEEALCRAYAERLGGGYADGVNSGTNAVFVAVRSLGLEPFTEVIVPPVTDPGGVMPVVLNNCIPITADAAPGSYNMGSEQIAERITSRTSAIVVAHIAGIPADMEPIIKLAHEHNLPVVEDCAQAHGALCRGKPVGTFGEVAAFSTMFGKHMSTGGQGGIVYTQSEDRYWAIRRAADRGKPFNQPDAAGNTSASLNCSMDELHATIGRVQLGKLPDSVKRRRQFALSLAQRCEQELATIAMVTDPPWGQSSFWFAFFHIDLDSLGVDKTKFVEALAAEGLPVGASYAHVAQRMPWFKHHAAFGTSNLPWSTDAKSPGPRAEQPLPNFDSTEPCHFRLTMHENCGEAEIEDLIEAMKKVERTYGLK